MSTAHLHAWRTRSSEHHLYVLFNLILSLSSLDLHHPNDSGVSVMCGPQALFGMIPPIGLFHAGKERSSKEMEQAKEALDDDNSEQTTRSVGALCPQKFPDFARFVISRDRNLLPGGLGLFAPYQIADFYELKALNCTERWWEEYAERAAGTIITSNLTQMYDTAMAGFAYNPAWKQAYGIIVAGAYFTFLVWKERPADHVLRPIPQTKIPKTVKEGVSYRRLIGRLLNQVEEYQRRVLPEVLYWNEPVFEYQSGDSDYRRISLTPKFLWAMRYSIKNRFPELLPRSALFTAPDKKPSMTKWTKVRIIKSHSSTILIIVTIYRPKLKSRSTRC